MSGIAALIRFDGGPADPVKLAAMTAAMAYRGPDNITHRTGGAAGIGHCALDASEAASAPQPLASADGAVLLAFDGYLANREELRADLLACGARPDAGGDAALMLRSYETWGGDFARRCEGEFACVLWDARRREAVCLRDHHGLRPLYWHWDGTRFIAASEIAAVIAALGQEPELNRGYLAEIAADEHLSPDETVWQGIMRLAPAHVLTVSGKGLHWREYWALPAQVDIRHASEADYAAHYRHVLSECVRRAARSHLPVACEVSGGLDSSSVFVLGQQLARDGRLDAPSLRGYALAGPPGSDADEIEYARLVARHAGAPLTERPLYLPPLDWFAARSALDRDLPPLPNAAMSITLDEAMRADGCRVSLGGIGGDQWCDGTSFYYSELFAERDWGRFLDCYRADIAAGGFAAASALMLRLGPGSLLAPRWRRRLRALMGGDAADGPAWIAPRYRRELAERRAMHAARFPPDYRTSYKLHKLRHPIWSKVLDQLSRQRSRSGIESRSPMMARQFIEFSARTPEHLKLRGGQSKYLHRVAMAGLLPPEVGRRETKAEFSEAYRHLRAPLRIACHTPPQSEAPLLDLAGIGALPGAGGDGDVDEGRNGALWGVYASILMVKAVGNFAQRTKP